jgi:hypothetical protein
MARVAGALPDITATQLESPPPQLMGTLWKQALESPNFAATAGISAGQAANIRIYQRIFLIDEN